MMKPCREAGLPSSITSRVTSSGETARGISPRALRGSFAAAASIAFTAWAIQAYSIIS